jgi:hypothetical protein
MKHRALLKKANYKLHLPKSLNWQTPRSSEESVKAVWTISELLQLAEPRNMSRFDITLI